MGGVDVKTRDAIGGLCIRRSPNIKPAMLSPAKWCFDNIDALTRSIGLTRPGWSGYMVWFMNLYQSTQPDTRPLSESILSSGRMNTDERSIRS